MKLHFSCILFTVFALSVSVTSCDKKESFQKDGNTASMLKNADDEYAMTTDDVFYENGMLNFVDYEAFFNVMQSLQQLTENDDYYDAALVDLGFNPSEDNELEPYHPVSKVFENRFDGYVSLRQYLENSERALLEQGVAPENIDNHFIADFYFQTLLSSNLEIKIGKTYMKLLDANRTLLVYNNLHLFNELKNASSIPVQPNVLVYNYLDMEHRKEFEDESTGYPKLDCHARFKYQDIGNNQFEFNSLSFGVDLSQHQNYTYSWNFGNGITWTQAGVLGANPPAVAYNPAGYPYTVTLTLTSLVTDCSDTYTLTIPYPGSCYATFQVTEDFSNAFMFYLDANTYMPNYGLQFDWTYGDGTGFVDGGPHVTKFYSQIYTYAQFDITLIAHVGSSCQWTETRSVEVGCGEKSFDERENENYAGSQRRIKCLAWLSSGLFQSCIGAETKHYRRKNNGNYVLEKASELVAGLNGNYFVEDPTGAPGSSKNCFQEEENGTMIENNKKIACRRLGNPPHRKFFIRNEDLTSFHRATDLGTTSNDVELIFDNNN